MNLFTYYKKRPEEPMQKIAVDRNRNQVVDIQVTKSRNFAAYYEMANMKWPRSLKVSIILKFYVPMDKSLTLNTK
jgi:hypothetical protein